MFKRISNPFTTKVAKTTTNLPPAATRVTKNAPVVDAGGDAQPVAPPAAPVQTAVPPPLDVRNRSASVELPMFEAQTPEVHRPHPLMVTSEPEVEQPANLLGLLANAAAFAADAEDAHKKKKKRSDFESEDAYKQYKKIRKAEKKAEKHMADGTEGDVAQLDISVFGLGLGLGLGPLGNTTVPPVPMAATVLPPLAVPELNQFDFMYGAAPHVMTVPDAATVTDAASPSSSSLAAPPRSTRIATAMPEAERAEKEAAVRKFAEEQGLRVMFIRDADMNDAFHYSDFDAYVTSGAADKVNDGVKKKFKEVYSSDSVRGKSFGPKSYGCELCGNIHQNRTKLCHTDPRCLQTSPSFLRFVQQFLFKYDVAPGQEWRNLYVNRTPGFRIAMAERFGAIVHAEGPDDPWFRTMQQRAWATRGRAWTSSAGSSRQIFEEGRIGEFLNAELSFKSWDPTTGTSPRPSCCSTTPTVAAPDLLFQPPQLPSAATTTATYVPGFVGIGHSL
jgi:hypothetical protein